MEKQRFYRVHTEHVLPVVAVTKQESTPIIPMCTVNAREDSAPQDDERWTDITSLPKTFSEGMKDEKVGETFDDPSAKN